ncbi:MAG TPA: trigger factor [Candidatus Paceibacterota bacterium]|nr:trigger factor [Candidatus Paceibacterota bacterium]
MSPIVILCKPAQPGLPKAILAVRACSTLLHFDPFSDNVQTMSTTHIKTEVKKLPNSQAEIKVTISYEKVAGYRTKSIAALQNTVEIDGFRKGHIPESKLVEKVGETGLLAEMADNALTDLYPTIIEQAKVESIGRPSISITKLAPDNDVEYVITTDIMPTVELKDVEKIAKAKNKESLEIEVTDEDIEKAIKEIRQMRAHQQMHDDGVDHHDHNHQNIADADLPELTDEYVKTLGAFENVSDFKVKLKENMVKEKETHAHEKRRIEIIESIIDAGTFDIPESMVDFELNKMFEQFNYDLSMSGMKMDEYLKHIGKTPEDMRNEWRPQAVKRVNMQMALEKIATDHKIKADQEKIDTQVAEILEMYKGQDVREENVIAYVTQTMNNAAVFDWLEAQK